jgi:hypothetical protein
MDVLAAHQLVLRRDAVIAAPLIGDERTRR